MSSLSVYLDNAATTAVDPAVLEAMLPYFDVKYANPAGSSSFSAIARNAVNTAREQVADLIGADPYEIVFTSGGTESDNMAVFGAVGEMPYFMRESGAGYFVSENANEVKNGYDSLTAQKCIMHSFARIITDRIEHPAVLNPCRELEKRGFEVLYAPCDVRGKIDTEYIKNHAVQGIALISVMLANNELGTIQEVGDLAEAAHNAGALLHTDAVQAAGHIPIDVGKLGVDLLSISSHKIHGPKGAGALFVKKGTKLHPLIFGGGQENGLRSGTLNVPGAVGLGKACELAKNELMTTGSEMIRRKKMFIDRLTTYIEGVHVNSPEDSVPSILSVSFERIEGSSLLIELDMKGICCATGSACSASSSKPSHVLTAAGISSERIRGSIRFSFSRFTTDEELEHTAKVTSECVKRLRSLL
ncbi:MAG: cysteine desulfurase [Lachnospiraceae bacterium]|nr:cysteine desulfurase [Lachnospiraceae bacterium]